MLESTEVDSSSLSFPDVPPPSSFQIKVDAFTSISVNICGAFPTFGNQPKGDVYIIKDNQVGDTYAVEKPLQVLKLIRHLHAYNYT